MCRGILDTLEVVESSTLDHRGMRVEELVYRDGDEFRLIWVRDSLGLMEVGGFANPCCHKKYPDPEYRSAVRRRVAEAFDGYWDSPKTVQEMAEEKVDGKQGSE